MNKLLAWWRGLDRNQRLSAIVLLALVVLFPLVLWSVQRQQDLRSRAQTPATPPTNPLPTPTNTPMPTPTPTPSISAHVGPGELEDISITSSISSWSTSGVSTTFFVKGLRVDSLASIIGYYPTGTTSNTVTFYKAFGMFNSNTKTFPYGNTCIDLQSGTGVYLASFCIRNNTVGYNERDYLYGASLEVDSNTASMRIYYRYNQYSPLGAKKAAQSMTMAFNRLISQNFQPTNFYWNLQTDLKPTHLDALEYWLRPNYVVPCVDTVAKLGVFASLSPDPNAKYFEASWVPDASGCWFRAKESVVWEYFFNQKVLALVKGDSTPTPTPTPLPSATPTPTLTSTPTPTPIQYTLNILTPNGGETLVEGNIYTITWDTTNNFTHVDLQYVTSNGFSASLAKGVSDTGSFTWQVNTLYPTEANYKIYIYGYNGIYMTANDSSDSYFKIVKPPTPTPTPTPLPTATPTQTPKPTPTPTPTLAACNAADINRDGIVDNEDYIALVTDYFKTQPVNPRSDINQDGIVDVTDYSVYVTQYLKSTGSCL
ncbi:hypothetical protein HY411_02045 [Candidatus Gottesmanbacteria bacterium]|nr:hypothetical protein [Candidatus Gottesmanbacteria bacterium]